MVLRSLVLSAATCLCLTVSPQLEAQQSDTAWKPIVTGGIFRASAVVDSVYLDRQVPSRVVDGGDFAAYLLARLGMHEIPPDFGYRVAVDTVRIRLGGRIADLPSEARQALSQLVMMVPASTRLEAQITLVHAGPEAMRFHLQSATVQGIPVPETLLQPMMASVGRQYPALTGTGRDLLVRIPSGAGMTLVSGGVLLSSP